jgi:hypothetical protein
MAVTKAEDGFGGDMHADAGEADDESEEVEEEDEDDFVEEYSREMSVELVTPRDMTLEERRLPIVSAQDNLRALVST